MRDVNLVNGKPMDRKDYKKLYNEKYRRTHNEQVICACGNIYREISKYSHVKSRVHKRFIEDIYGGTIDECGNHNDNGDSGAPRVEGGKNGFEQTFGKFLLW